MTTLQARMGQHRTHSSASGRPSSVSPYPTVEGLDVDAVLFVGDIANEDPELVRLIASLRLPYAVILGNHDCWNTTSRAAA